MCAFAHRSYRHPGIVENIYETSSRTGNHLSASPLPSAPVYRFGTPNAEKDRGEYLPLEVATSEKELCELLFDIPANKNIKLCEECSRYSWIILNLPPYLTFSLSLSHSVQHSKVGKPSSFFDNHSDVCQPAGNILAKKYQTCSCCLLVTSSCNSKQMERDTWARIKNIQPPSVPIYSSQLCLHHATL